MLTIERARELLHALDRGALQIIRSAEIHRLNDAEQAVQMKGSALRGPASATELTVLSDRRLQSVPDEVLCLLQVSNGFLLPALDTESVWFLSAAEIDLYRTVHSDDFAMWESELQGVLDVHLMALAPNGSEPLELPTIGLLRNALALSQKSGSTTLLACPTGSTWNYLIHSAHRQTTLFGSLEALLEYEIKRSLSSLRESLEVDN